MKTCLLSFVLVFVAAASTARAQGPGTATTKTLTNASVVKLVRAGFKEKTVIAIINSRPVRFDLSPDRLIELKKGGVAEKIILAMLSRNAGGTFAADDWGDDDDDFFGSKNGAAGGTVPPGRSAPGAARNPGETNIFGSSGGSKGRTR